MTMVAILALTYGMYCIYRGDQKFRARIEKTVVSEIAKPTKDDLLRRRQELIEEYQEMHDFLIRNTHPAELNEKLNALYDQFQKDLTDLETSMQKKSDTIAMIEDYYKVGHLAKQRRMRE